MNVNVQQFARPGRVVELTGDGYYLVEVGGGIVPAYLSDQSTAASVGLDSMVTLLPMLGGFEIVSVRTGPSGGGGVVLGPELVANGGFESGVPGSQPDGWFPFWVFEGGTVEVSTDAPLLGSQCALVAMRPETDDVIRVSRNPTRIDAATTYRMSAYCSARIASGTGVVAAIELLTGDSEANCDYLQPGSASPVVASLNTPGEAWPLLTGDVTVPTGHTWFRPVLRLTADPNANLTIRWDQVSLRQRLA